MSRVPVVDSPCPIANRPLPAGASDHCAQCDRTVHNLDRMSASERRVFMNGCSGKVCVAYTIRIPAARVPLRPRGLAVAALATAALASLPAAAVDDSSADAPSDAMLPMPGTAPQFPNCDSFGEVLVTGGVRKGDQAEWVDDGKDAPPDLPTIEDDGR
jgi:hypothetical protein